MEIDRGAAGPTSCDQPSIGQLLPGSQIAPLSAAVICGTDFSDWAAHAMEVASAFAQRLGEPLVLVHAVNDKSQENLPCELRESLSLYARAQLHDEEERLRALKVEMIAALRVGPPAAVLLEEVVAHHGRLIVLAAEKGRFPTRWLHSGVTERVAEAASVPTLVVRDPAPLLRWANGGRRLRVLVGADFSAPSEAALRWVAWLRSMGPCDIVVACLEPIPALHPTGDLFPSLLMDEMVLKTTHMQERSFRRRVRNLIGSSRVRVRLERDWGHSDAHLIQLAAEERADLIVVGTHSRRSWHRLGHHSVSRGVLRYAPINVACVPGQANEQPKCLL
ncbi:MAG: universal stress protein [Chthoniobacter sp.]|nr:universal stress protein [Chthoniobacter sp.]